MQETLLTLRGIHRLTIAGYTVFCALSGATTQLRILGLPVAPRPADKTTDGTLPLAA